MQREDSILAGPTFASTAIDMDALAKSLAGLQGKVDPHPKTAAIILAGGSGDRFGHEGGKQLVEIAGKPILTWSAEAFDSVGDVGLIVIVCPEERHEEYLKCAVDPFPFVTPVTVAPSGPSRQESAFSGLESVPDEYEYVMLHDGARPLVTPQLIEHVIAVVKGNIDCDGAIVGNPAVDTLKVLISSPFSLIHVISYSNMSTPYFRKPARNWGTVLKLHAATGGRFSSCTAQPGDGSQVARCNLRTVPPLRTSVTFIKTPARKASKKPSLS